MCFAVCYEYWCGSCKINKWTRSRYIYDLHSADIFFALYEIRKRYNFYLPFSPLHLIILLPPLSPSLPTTALQLCTLHSPLPGILTPVVISSDRVKEVSALTLRTRPIISTSQSSLNAWQAVNEPSRSFHGVQTREGLLNRVSRCEIEIRTLVWKDHNRQAVWLAKIFSRWFLESSSWQCPDTVIVTLLLLAPFVTYCHVLWRIVMYCPGRGDDMLY